MLTVFQKYNPETVFTVLYRRIGKELKKYNLTLTHVYEDDFDFTLDDIRLLFQGEAGHKLKHLFDLLTELEQLEDKKVKYCFYCDSLVSIYNFGNDITQLHKLNSRCKPCFYQYRQKFYPGNI